MGVGHSLRQFGWGWLFQGLLSVSGRALGGAYGLSVVMTLSGIANVTGKFGLVFIIAMVGGGCFAASAFLIHWTRHQKLPSLGPIPGRIFAVSLLVFLAFGQFAFRTRTMEFSHVDDYQARTFPHAAEDNPSGSPSPWNREEAAVNAQPRDLSAPIPRILLPQPLISDP